MTQPDKRASGPSPSTHFRAEDYTDEWGESSSLQALRALTDAATAVRPAIARRAGLSHSELVALEHLFGSPLGPAEVARRLGVTTAASTTIIDRLAGRGHVERSPHSTDRRRTEVAITPSGRQEVLTQLMPMFAALGQMDADLTDEEREIVTGYLERATAALRTVL